MGWRDRGTELCCLKSVKSPIVVRVEEAFIDEDPSAWPILARLLSWDEWDGGGQDLPICSHSLQSDQHHTHSHSNHSPFTAYNHHLQGIEKHVIIPASQNTILFQPIIINTQIHKS